MLSGKSSHSSINEYCRYTAPSTLGAKKILKKYINLFFKSCYYYFQSFYSINSLRLFNLQPGLVCYHQSWWEEARKALATFSKIWCKPIQRKLHTFINQFNHNLLQEVKQLGENTTQYLLLIWQSTWHLLYKTQKTIPTESLHGRRKIGIKIVDFTTL